MSCAPSFQPDEAVYIRAWYLAGYSSRQLAKMASCGHKTILSIVNRTQAYALPPSMQQVWTSAFIAHAHRLVSTRATLHLRVAALAPGQVQAGKTRSADTVQV